MYGETPYMGSRHLSDREASKGREVSHPQQHSFEQQALGK